MKQPYSPWLLPPPAAADRLRDLIRDLARRLSTPAFEPHITLCAPNNMTEADATLRAERLATRLAPISVYFDGIGHTDAYFRCLFLRAQKTKELLEAHRIACGHMGQAVEADFMPHLSLVYGKFELAMKENLAAELVGRFPRGIAADRIGVVAIDGAPNAWRVLGPFALQGAAK